MKKIIVSIFAISSVISWSGCKKLLDREPRTAINIVTLFQTYESAERAVNACYDPLGNERNYLGVFWSMGDCASGDTEVGGSFTGGPAENQAKPIMLFKAQSTNSFIEGFTKNSYLMIQRCNTVLKGTESVSYDATRLRGEAYFLRGLAYFNLYQIFGPMPIITTPISKTDFDKNNPSNRQSGDDNKGTKQMEKMFEQMISDFEKAAENLPSKAGVIAGRATKGAANAYLAKVYAFKASMCQTGQLFSGQDSKDSWKKVVEYAQKVQDDGYSLTPDYHKIFTIESENDNESIFEVQFLFQPGYPGPNSESSILTIDFSPRQIQGITQFGFGMNSPTLSLVSAFDLNQNGVIKNWTSDMTIMSASAPEMKKSAPKLQTQYSGYDPRLDMIIKPGDSLCIDLKEKTWRMALNSQSAKGFWNGKFMPNIGRVSAEQAGEGLNYKMYRFADLLLLKAEAEYTLGNSNNALQLVNMVRKRARDSRRVIDPSNSVATYMFGYKTDNNGTVPADYTEITMDKIRLERRLELFLEFHRFFDLVRWGIANDVAGNKEKCYGSETYSWKKDQSIRLPIAQQIILESKGSIVQNPGY
jgi:hypothetical protein